MRFATAATLAMIALPAAAQERWTHASSGASLPRTFEEQTIIEQRDLGSANDTVVNYEAKAGLESTTVYVFQAAVPHARLWFDRAMPTVSQQIPLNLFDAGSIEQIAAFGSSAPNGVRQVFAAKQAGPFKTTALVIAQSGPWIVKLRATSATLDAAGLSRRIDRHLAAIRIAPPSYPPSLDALPACEASISFGTGKPMVPDASMRIQAAVSTVAAHALVHRPPADLCQADKPNVRFSLLGRTSAPDQWLLLMGDAGQAIGVERMDGAPAHKLVYVATPAATRAATIFDASPTLEAAVAAAAPIIRNPDAALVSISSSPKKN